MHPILSGPRAYLRDARDAFTHAPLEVLIGIAAAVSFSLSLRQHAPQPWTFVVAGIGLPAVFGLSVLHARGVIGGPARWLASGAVLIAAGLYATFVFELDRGSEMWRAFCLAVASVMAFSLVPLAGAPRGDDGEARRRFWSFNLATAGRVAAVGFWGMALWAALAGAVSAVVSLFGLGSPGNLYGDLWGAVAFALVPWVIVGGLPELAARMDDGGRPAPRAARLLGSYLYLPVLAVYLAILAAYTLRIVATGEFPRNLLSPLVLFAGLFGFLGSLLLEPLVDDPEHPALSRLIRFFPAVLLPLLLAPVYAVWVRRGQYGWTEFRYIRLALLLTLLGLAVAGTVRLARRRRPLLAAVPAALGALFLLAAVGPWSASAVSRRDQAGRLRDALRQAGLLEGDTVRSALPKRSVPRALYDRIESAAEYLRREHGQQALAAVIPAAGKRTGGFDVMALVPATTSCAHDYSTLVTGELPGGEGLQGVAGGTLYHLPLRAAADVARDAGPRLVRGVGSSVLVSQRSAAGTWSAAVDLAPIAARIVKAAAGTCSPSATLQVLTQAEALHPLVDAAGGVRGQLVVTRLSADQRSSAAGKPSAPRLLDVDAWVVLSK
ncbi:MAG: hypothetical protein JWM27_4521 [Gemmatimonadetes bacterium]|nr:hypothetical protein [Gemmatimonadota bacterium]